MPLPVPVVDWKGKGKAEDTTAASPSSKRARPGPLSARRPYVDLKVLNRKRKFAEVEETKDDDDNDNDKHAYMSGRLNGLHSFIDMFETTFAAMKKEVADINSYLGSKRRRLQ